jgi:hypothetical protein
VKAVEQEPTDCLKNLGAACSIFAFAPARVKTKNLELGLASGSILFRARPNEWNFVAGTIRVAARRPIKIVTKVGTVTLGIGVSWLQWRDERLWVYVFEGPTAITLTESSMQYNAVPEGFYNWFGLIDRTGKNVQGVPRAITVTEAKMSLPGISRHPDLKMVTQRETRTIAMASEFYGDVAQRMENAFSLREYQAEQEQRKRREKEKRAREMFRSKYLGPVEFD